MLLKPTARALALGSIVFLCACAGPSRSYKQSLLGSMAAGDFAKARSQVQAVKEREYGKKNAVLYYLDLGMLQHDAAQYKESDSSLDAAERRMDELFTKSVSRSLGTVLINDNTTEYVGESYERALLNVFRALDYVFLDDIDDALVEARKVSQFLDELNRTSGSGEGVYRDDAFAQYLAALIFEDGGKYDDARICRDDSRKAYSWYSGLYSTPEPQFDLPKIKDGGELVFLHYNGMAPAKVSKTFQVAWGEALVAVNSSGDAEAESAQFKNALNAGIAGNSITVAYPEFADMPFSVAYSEIDIEGRTYRTQLMEDISAIAKAELARKTAAQRIRMIARATIKYVLSQQISKKVENNQGQGLGFLAKMVTSAVSAATEIADTRSWATLPAQIRMSRANLPAGKHDVLARFFDSSGRMLATQLFKDVEIKKGARTYLHHRTAQ